MLCYFFLLTVYSFLRLVELLLRSCKLCLGFVSCFLRYTISFCCLFILDFNSSTSSLIFLFSSRILYTVICISTNISSLFVMVFGLCCEGFTFDSRHVRSLGIRLPFFYGTAFTTFVLSTRSSNHMIVTWVIPCSLILKKIDYFRTVEGRNIWDVDCALKRVHHASPRMGELIELFQGNLGKHDSMLSFCKKAELVVKKYTSVF